MPDFTVNVALVSTIEVESDGIHVTKQNEITRTTYGLSAPALMVPFVHLITLHVVVSDVIKTRPHLVHFQIRHPDGSDHLLVQARISDWPEWVLEHASAEDTRAAEDREIYLQPSDEMFVAGERWRNIRPLALTLPLAGDYVLRMIVDRHLVAESPFRVVYDRRREERTPI